MLTELNIKNFILIENHKINLNKGFSTLTGETGAGKSIILGALNLIKGQRADVNSLKDKTQNCTIEAIFNIKDCNNVKKLLIDNDLIDEENPDIMSIRRVILTNGKTNGYINNLKSSLSPIKEITKQLIEIHSQNTNKNIIDQDKQLTILDIYSGIQEEVFDLNKITSKINIINKNIKKIKEEKENQKSKVELIKYKLEELEEIDLQENEYVELTDDYNKLSNAEKIDSTCYKQIKNIDEANSTIYKVNEDIEELDIFDENIENRKMLEEVLINLEEIKSNIKNIHSSLVFDNFKLSEIEKRIDQINTLSKKHFVEPENFTEYINSLKEELNSFDSFDEDIDKLTKERIILESEWLKDSKNISIKRHSNAIKFEKIISEKINILKMKNAIFKINFKENKNNFCLNGNDNISFEISTNLGSEFEELKKAASGGELSRIALSIQSTISKNYNIPIQIFDEIDSGIGGTTGNTMGLFLKEISNNSQVISITHLAQVAVFADNNYYIYKNEEENNKKTNTYIKLLNKAEKYKEFSRMMGYEEFNDKNEQIVKELIKNSLKIKI
jgi:DNA repair protein RecN (Recombination protein N)